MRLLLLGESLYPAVIGGVERRNADLAAALGRRGHDVTLAGFGSAESPGAGVGVLSLGAARPIYGSGGTRSMGSAVALARRASRVPLAGYDVVETSNIPFAHLAPLAVRCAALGKPLLVSWYEFWGAYWKQYVGRTKAPAFRAAEWLAAQAGFALASSRLTASRLERRRLRQAAIPIVPCGTDVAEIAAAVSDLRETPGRLVFAGRLLAHKRVDLLLEALALLPAASLVVYGDGPERRSLAERADGLGVAPRVEFRTPTPDRADLWREIRRSAVAVQPSAREGFGIFPLEAMAAAVPVVYCRAPESALSELVRDGLDGVCAEPSPRALAEAVGALLLDAPRRRAMGDSARARAAEFSADDAARRFESLAAALLAGRGAAAAADENAPSEARGPSRS